MERDGRVRETLRSLEMAETNGKVERLAPELAAARAAVGSEDESLVADLESSYPFLRRFVVGGRSEGSLWPAGTISLRRSPHGIRVAIRIPALQLEAVYHFRAWSEMWETIDNDLSNRTVPWQLDYQAQREEDKRLQKLL